MATSRVSFGNGHGLGDTRSIADAVARLHVALQRVRVAVPRAEATRFGHYYKQLESYVRHREGIRSSKRKRIHIALMLYETEELLFVLDSMTDDDLAIYSDRIREGMGGTLFAGGESRKSNSRDARNKMFELLVIAQALNSKCTVVPHPVADTVIEESPNRYFVECKRPLHERKLARAIRDASEQIERRVSSTDNLMNPFGIVAINVVDDSAGDGHTVWHLSGENTAAQQHAMVYRHCSEYIVRNMPLLRGLAGTPTVCVLLYFGQTFIDHKENRYSMVTPWWIGTTTRDEDVASRDAAEVFGQAFVRGFNAGDRPGMERYQMEGVLTLNHPDTIPNSEESGSQ